ncbi:MAG: hypothetical protein AMXMBFR57_14390 [Acidimicrobiia bacterium]
MSDADVFDGATLNRLLALGDHTFLDELFQLFIDDLDLYMPLIETALAAGQAPSVAGHAHAIKGAAGNVGALRVAACAASLERHARADSLSEAEGMFEALCDAVSEARAAIAARPRG